MLCHRGQAKKKFPTKKLVLNHGLEPWLSFVAGAGGPGAGLGGPGCVCGGRVCVWGGCVCVWGGGDDYRGCYVIGDKQKNSSQQKKSVPKNSMLNSMLPFSMFPYSMSTAPSNQSPIIIFETVLLGFDSVTITWEQGFGNVVSGKSTLKESQPSE